MGEIVTPVQSRILDEFLEGYDVALRKELVEGFSGGFSIHHKGIQDRQRSPNLTSAYEVPEAVDAKIAKELAAGRLAGPFTTSPYLQYVVSPLGTAPKKEPGEYRLIHHLSYPPKGISINSGIPDTESSVQYASISDAVTSIQKLGRGCWMAKCDVKSAFRIIPIKPSERHLLGFKWNNYLYFDKCLPMGCSSSCKTFEKVSTALEWICIHKLGIRSVVHVLDDFLFLARSKRECQQYLSSFLNLCSSLGVPIAPEKTKGPARVLDFVGLELNSIEMSVKLPSEKIIKYLSSINQALSSKSISKRDIQVLAGQLNFASSVVMAGKAFNRRLYSLLQGLSSPFVTVALPASARADLECWKVFLHQYNGVTIFPNNSWISSQSVQLLVGSNQSRFWGSFRSHWFSSPWEPSPPSFDSRDLFSLLCSLTLWAHFFRNSRLLLLTANSSTVKLINCFCSKDQLALDITRKIHLICMINNIILKAKYDSKVSNVPPQLLSSGSSQKGRLPVPPSVYPGGIGYASTTS